MDHPTADRPASGLAELLEAERPALLRFLAARTGDAALAEDLVQELWIKARAPGLVPIENARAYLFRMANNLVLDHARGTRRRAARDHGWSEAMAGQPLAGDELVDPAADAQTLLESREEVALLASAIANLPPAAGRAFRMHKLEEMSLAEVAAALEISKSGVEKHIALAMAHLRRALRD